MACSKPPLDFNTLITSIRQVNDGLQAQVGKAVNASVTIRNWLIGFYIHEYEQNGQDRAEYGAKLLETLSKQLKSKKVTSVTSRSLRLYRQFYLLYPQIRQTLSAESLDLSGASIWQTVSAKSELKAISPSEQSLNSDVTLPGKTLLERLSFSHFVE